MTLNLLSAREVAAYDDTQLDRLLDELRQRCPDEPLVLDFDEPGILSDAFFERLR